AFRGWIQASDPVLPLPAAQGLAQQRLDLTDVLSAWLKIVATGQVSESLRRALGQWPDAVGRVLDCAQDERPRVRAGVAHVLRVAQQPRDAILRALAGLLCDGDESVRASAARSVVGGKWQSPSFVDPLVALLEDPRQERLAVQALRAQGGL